MLPYAILTSRNKRGSAVNIGRVDHIWGGKDRYAGNTAQLETDLARLGLLVFMVIAAFIGSHITNYFNRPDVVVRGAVKKTLRQSHQVTFEGSVSIGKRELAMYRMQQSYDPDTGLTVSASAGNSNDPPFDAVEVLELIRGVESYTEHPMQDMYHRATRHYSGTVADPNGDEQVTYVFNCWVESQKGHMVRVSFAGVRRNAGTAPNGEPISEETYLNIRYHDYRN